VTYISRERVPNNVTDILYNNARPGGGKDIKNTISINTEYQRVIVFIYDTDGNVTFVDPIKHISSAGTCFIISYNTYFTYSTFYEYSLNVVSLHFYDEITTMISERAKRCGRSRADVFFFLSEKPSAFRSKHSSRPNGVLPSTGGAVRRAFQEAPLGDGRQEMRRLHRDRQLPLDRTEDVQLYIETANISSFLFKRRTYTRSVCKCDCKIARS